MPNNFAHLHLHTEHSQLDGVGTSEDYAREAARLGQKALAITDHGNIDGILKHQKACRKHGIIPVLGCELYLCQDMKARDDQRHHLVALVRSREGLTNLMRILSVANLDGFYKRPRIDPPTLLAHTKGLVFLTACINSFVNMPKGEALLQQLGQSCPTFLEVMPHGHPKQKEHNLRCLALCRKYGIPLVATNDCHYPRRGMGETQEVLLAMKRNAKWGDRDRWTMRDWPDLHLRSADEMARAFATQGILEEQVWRGAMARTAEVAALCNGYTVARVPVELPKVRGHADRDETELMWEAVADGWQRRAMLPGREAEYEARVNEEFDLICRMGFQRYFLIVWELINWCKGQGIMVGPGRGSIGGSLVAYLMGITDVDPIRYGLIFARFISPERQDLPDIDMDFEDARREEVRQHLRDCYGEHNVAGLSTFLTMKGKASLRNVARVFDVPLKEVNLAAKSIISLPDGHDRSGHTIEDGLRNSPPLADFQRKWPDVVRHAMNLEGQVFGSGQHPAATCLALGDLRNGLHCNLVRRKDVLVANWEMTDAEHMGLMKLDVLGLSALSILNGARRMIRDGHGMDIEFDRLPLDDHNVYREIAQGNTAGAFQIGSTLNARYCQELGVREFNDIVLINALTRPGPLGSGMTDQFIKRRHGREPVSYIHPRMEPYTRETLGLVIFQEQVMWSMFELAGLPWADCDRVRKVMGKSKGGGAFEKFRQQFVNGCISQGTLNGNEAAHTWDMMASFGSYAYNKSHATAYSLIGYWMMYCRVHYPQEFLAACLTWGGQDEQGTYVDEARRLGIRVELPKAGVSLADRWLSQDKALWAPLTAIKGVGASQAAKILAGKVNDKPGIGQDRKQVWSQPAFRGFFDKEIGPPPQVDNPGVSAGANSMARLLRRAGYHREKDLTWEELREAAGCYDFNILTGRERFRRLEGLADLPERDILACRLDGRANLIAIGRYILPAIDCRGCELINECTRPVQPSFGRYRVMVVGEAPGKQEDQRGMGFVGGAGEDILWPELWRYGLAPTMFHVTNICKCFVDPNIKIYTLNGEKNICDIKIGDMVLTHKGRFKEVKWVRPNEKLKRGSKLIKIKVKVGGAYQKGQKSFLVTPEHPFLLEGDNWIKANDIKTGVKLKALAKKCLQCEQLIPYMKKSDFCCRNCAIIYFNKNKEYDKEKISKNMKQLYENGVIDRKAITKNANKKTRDLVKNNQHHLQTPNRTVVSQWKGKTKWTDDKLFRASQRMVETKKKNGEDKKQGIRGMAALKKYYETHERTFKCKHTLTKIEAIMAWGLNKRGYTGFLQNKYLCGFYPDILFEQSKIIIECDGERFHSSQVQIERDKKRDRILIDNGYSVIRFGQKEIEAGVFGCVDKFERLLNNHSGKYELINIEVTHIKNITTMGRTLYNFGVEDDESYIANGIVSHNCWPARTKTPGRRHIAACARWLDMEFDGLRPVMALAFGGTGVKALRDGEGKISELNGRTEWSDRHQCWISWCLHPASVLHNPGNRSEFIRGIENFAHRLKAIGGDVWAGAAGKFPARTPACPYGGDFGDANGNYAECTGCPVWEQCAAEKSKTDWLGLQEL